MAKNLENVRIYGDEAGGAWVAPRGTTGPTGLDEPPAGFVEIGWLSEDGIDESLDQNSEPFRAWQGAKIVRRKVTSSDTTFKFQALEENLAVHGLKYRGQEPVVATGVATTTVKDQVASDTRAWVFDMLDGDVHKRYVIPAGDYARTGTIQHRNAAMTIHEFEVTPIGDWFEITDNPAIVGSGT
ncbi:hypothetical protein [Tessaracoccus massiliensis]|uniref:phage tail tube protein n=1 Tax=Tessaracoccus massiliensis TaxID=1522311 RepID=UPI000590F668|nr:hypothetical protein [Tessaracoccus massiliensis]